MNLPLQPNLLGLPLAPAHCVIDAEKDDMVEIACKTAIDNHCLLRSDLLQQYLQKYTEWIYSTNINQVVGLDQFPCVSYSAGTSESFDKFYLKHHQRRFRCFRGEYIYHTLSWDQQNINWLYLDDDSVMANDAVIISLPFADTGSIHSQYTVDLLDRCLLLGVPVLLDCAFFGICGNINFDFTHPAIQEICFSLSKAFPANSLRIGIRYQRNDDRDSLIIYNNTQYINKFGLAVGIELMKMQHPDEIFIRYRDQQLIWCKKYGLEPSNTVIFGIDSQHNYDNYNRGSINTNRLCFSKYFNTGSLPL